MTISKKTSAAPFYYFFIAHKQKERSGRLSV